MNETLDVEHMPTQAIARRTDMAVSTPMSVNELVGQVTLIQEVMRSVMKEGEHYGKIPGCGDKPALLKAGAEKLGMTFRLAPVFDINRTDMAGGHREYQVICTLNGKYQGVGTCCTMEGKYRFRTGPKKPTGKPVPKEYWDTRQSNPGKAQSLLGGKGFSTMKDDGGNWVICEQGERVEHDNPADHYNTVLKMAKKRAHVDAVLTATAASDIFTQDIEELTQDEPEKPTTPRPAPATKAAPKPATAQPDLSEQPTPATLAWESAVVPSRFKKHGNKPLGQLKSEDVSYIWWLIKNFKAEPYNGKPPTQADVEFRIALDLAENDLREATAKGAAEARAAIDDSDQVPF